MFKSFLRSPCVQLCYLSCSYFGLEPGLSSLEKKEKKKRWECLEMFNVQVFIPYIYDGWIYLKSYNKQAYLPPYKKTTCGSKTFKKKKEK